MSDDLFSPITKLVTYKTKLGDRQRRVRVNPLKQDCQICSVRLIVGENWSISQMEYRRYLCMPCYAQRQKRYSCKVPKSIRNEATRKSRLIREQKWSEDRKNKERLKDYNRWLRNKYNIDLSKYEEMLNFQNHSCAICGTTDAKGRGIFHVDHCHATGKVRGLLCAKCNLMLGHADDDLKILYSAINYLQNKGVV